MMSRLSICSFLTILISAGSAERAMASQQSGSIAYYAIPSQGSVAFMLTGTRTAKPACATDDNWSVPQASPHLDKILAAAMTAKASGRTIQVYGKGTCDPGQSTREEIDYVIFG